MSSPTLVLALASLVTAGPIVTLAATAAVAARAPTVQAARWRSLIGATLALVLALIAALTAHGTDGRAPAGVYWGLDALSAPLFPFVVALVTVITLAAPNRLASPAFFARLSLSGALFVGVLASRHPLLLALLWLGSSIPTALELGTRPGGRTFAVHRVASTLLVVAGLLASHGPWAPLAAPLAAPMVVLGVLIREGMVPFHAWVPSLYERATLGSALLFSRAQLGAYLLARVVVADPLGGSTSWLLDVLGVATLLYGAALALAQVRVRRALGYFATSQSAIVLLGLADGGPIGARGAVLVIVSVGLAQTGLGLALWVTEARRGELRLDVPGEGFARTPALAGATLFLGLACVGLPGTLAFVAEELVFHATLEARPWVGVAMIVATAINGVMVLRIALRVFGGKSSSDAADLLVRERVAFGLLGLCLVAFGLAPQRLLVGSYDAENVHSVASSEDTTSAPDRGSTPRLAGSGSHAP